MSLPERWIERIFARLLVRYGAAWLRMWEGVDVDALKADWATHLAGYADKPSVLTHALENLPADKPPTVAQFALLCRSAPQYAIKRLPAPLGDKELGRQIAAGLAHSRRLAQPPRDATVERLRALLDQGVQLTQYQRDALRELSPSG
ncbi:MAG TPA: hypothetical protein VGM81_22265 [Burkholderiaceae bacterium]|jgi:hypothetical protein